jgi:hypothetical protein
MNATNMSVPGDPAHIEACRLLTDTLARVGDK